MWCSHSRRRVESFGEWCSDGFRKSFLRWTRQISVALYGRSWPHFPHKILPALQVLIGAAFCFPAGLRSTLQAAQVRRSVWAAGGTGRHLVVLPQPVDTEPHCTWAGCWYLSFSIRWQTDGRKEFSFIIAWRMRDMPDCWQPRHVLGGVTVLRNLWYPAFLMILVPTAYWVEICDRSLFLHLSTLVCLGTLPTEDEGNTPGRNVGKHKPCNTGDLTPHRLT